MNDSTALGARPERTSHEVRRSEPSPTSKRRSLPATSGPFPPGPGDSSKCARSRASFTSRCDGRCRRDPCLLCAGNDEHFVELRLGSNRRARREDVTEAPAHRHRKLPAQAVMVSPRLLAEGRDGQGPCVERLREPIHPSPEYHGAATLTSIQARAALNAFSRWARERHPIARYAVTLDRRAYACRPRLGQDSLQRYRRRLSRNEVVARRKIRELWNELLRAATTLLRGTAARERERERERSKKAPSRFELLYEALQASA